MDSPTSSVYSTEPRTPVSSAAEFSSPSTPRTGVSVLTPGFTPGTSFYDESSIVTPLKRLSFSTPVLHPAPKRKGYQQEQVELRRGSQSQEAPVRPAGPDRKPSIITYQPVDPFGTLHFERPIATGQWSKVCLAKQVSLSKDRENNPPNRVYAAKIGVGRSAQEVLKHEARILSRLSSHPAYADYVVGYEGYDLQHKAVMLEYLPLTLEDWIQQLGTIRNETSITQKLQQELRSIIKRLVGGLIFLHAQGIVHADIKPANILLRPEASSSGSAQSNPPTAYQPLFCDFTASLVVEANMAQTSSLAGAGTYDFMAPELFASTAVATQASDVYALGVTILTAVLGHSPYDGANNMFMRRAMAMNGSPLEFATNSMNGVKRCNAMNVQQWVGGALKKKAADRWTADEWIKILHNLA